MKPKIYIDCTHTYFSNLNTGIQRTVRNIANNVNDNDVYLAVFNRGNYHLVTSLPEPTFNIKENRLKIYAKKIYKTVRDLLGIFPPLKKLLYKPEITTFLSSFYDKLLKKENTLEGEKIDFKKGDTLLLLDSTWSDTDYHFLENLKKRSVHIVSVVYDIIPISHSKFCSDDLVFIYKNWLKKILNITDKYITISKTVKDDFQKLTNKKDLKVEHFYLGGDFSNKNFQTEKIEESFQSIFQKRDTYITVSTIEPRKNHQFALDAFEELWKDNIDVNYVIIGRVGWKVDALIQRVKNHKEYNKKLFLLDSIDDNHLNYAYKNAKALIFPSFTEGFGLPIIESLVTSLQVLASDTAIHREIGEDKISYFSLDDVNSLKKLILDFPQKDLDNFQWKNWRESGEELFTKVRTIIQ